MRQRAMWSAVLVVGLALAGCGSASDSGKSSGGSDGKLVVWDWKSGEPFAESYLDKAKADFKKKHADVTVEFVAQPFDQYYTLLGAAIQSGKGPDVMLFNGGGQIRDRVDALVPLDDYVAEDKQRLAGWEAFSKDGKIYAAPVTLQGYPIYYNKALYQKADLDPASPATTWDKFVADCAAIAKAGSKCFALGNKEGVGIQFWLSSMGSATLTAAEYDAWIAGKRDWNSPNVKRIFQLWKETGDKKMNSDGANSTAMFNDSFALFQSGKAAHVMGLMSDVGHWKDFNEFLTAGEARRHEGPGRHRRHHPEPPVRRWHRLRGRQVDEGPEGGRRPGALPELGRRAEGVLRRRRRDRRRHHHRRVAGRAGRLHDRRELKSGKPALHVALSSKTLDLMGRLSQQLLSGSITVDEVVKQLAASDQAG